MSKSYPWPAAPPYYIRSFLITHDSWDSKYDSVSDHWLLTCENMDGVRVPVGTVRMYMVGEKVGKLGRLAVLQDARGLRCGQSLVKTLCQSAHERGLDAIMCEAQVDKRGFYEKLGFVIEKGDEEAYPVDGTPHYKMWKRSLP